jgi:hypothetical protein
VPEIRTYCQCDPVFARGTGNSNVFWDNLYGHHYNYAYSNDFDRREVKLIPDVSQALAWLEKIHRLFRVSNVVLSVKRCASMPMAHWRRPVTLRPLARR